MLTLHICMEEGFDNEKEEFVPLRTVPVQLEHSLVSIARWESVWEKPFLGKEEKTTEETISYLRLMLLTENLPPAVFERLIQKHGDEVKDYIGAKMTATWFSEDQNKRHSREIITAEIIYYWMVSLNIPFECQYWHLNRLITLVRVINEKNAPAKKQDPKTAAARRRQLNKQRKAQLGTRG